MAYDLSTYAGRQQARDDAAAAGRSVVVDAGGIYNRNTGQTSGGNTSFSGGAPSGPAGPAPSANDQAILDAFKASSGFSQQDLAERKRQFDANLEWTKQMWANQGLPELQIRQQAQALAQREFEAQNALAQQNFGLAQRAQGFTEEMGRSQLGMDYLKTAASMGGPADVFQAADFTRGVAQSGNAPAFLQALRNNTGLAAFNAPSGAAPQALTPDILAQRVGAGGMQGGAFGITDPGFNGAASAAQKQAMMTGGDTGTMMFHAMGGPGGVAGAAPPQTNPALQAIGNIAQAGGAALGPQSIESLNPDELAAMGSGFKKLGFSLPAFLSQYQQSRIGQGAAQAA